MTNDDLQRWLEGNEHPHARALLEAGRADQPPPDFSKRLLVGLGIGSAVAATTSVAAAKSSSGVVATWLLAGFVGGGIVAGGASALLPAPGAPAAAVARTPTATIPHQPHAAPALAASDESEPESVVAPPVQTATPRAPVSAASSSAGQLGREVQLIDSARRALATGNTSLASTQLDEYRRIAITGVLDREARVLRIETLLRQGDRERAATLAKAYISELPNDPHSARLRSLLGID